MAAEIRHPPLVAYLATAFDRLWRLATPMYPEAVQRPALNGVTPRRRAIAASWSRATRMSSSPTGSA